MDNYQLSEHIVCVQRLLDRCAKPANCEKHSESEKTTDWYRYWKPSTRRLCMQDLCCQPMRLVANVNAFSNIGAASTGAQVAQGPTIFDSDSIKKTVNNPLQNIASSAWEQRYVFPQPSLVLWGSCLSTQTSCAPLIRITCLVAQRLS